MNYFIEQAAAAVTAAAATAAAAAGKQVLPQKDILADVIVGA